MRNLTHSTMTTASPSQKVSSLQRTALLAALCTLLVLASLSLMACTDQKTLEGTYVRQAEDFSTTTYTFTKDGQIDVEMTILQEDPPVTGYAQGHYELINGGYIDLSWTKAPDSDLFRFKNTTVTFSRQGRTLYIDGYEFIKQ